MDICKITTRIVEEAIGEPLGGKNPFAVALGRLGGLRGGKARANKLSAKRRKEIAKKVATARWESSKDHA